MYLCEDGIGYFVLASLHDEQVQTEVLVVDLCRSDQSGVLWGELNRTLRGGSVSTVR